MNVLLQFFIKKNDKEAENHTQVFLMGRKMFKIPLSCAAFHGNQMEDAYSEKLKYMFNVYQKKNNKNK